MAGWLVVNLVVMKAGQRVDMLAERMDAQLADQMVGMLADSMAVGMDCLSVQWRVHGTVGLMAGEKDLQRAARLVVQ